MSHSPALPSPDPKDSEQVALCLETAQRLCETGDLKEAVRWLRRGAEAAEQAGDDLRAVALARAAADVTALAGPSLPPPLPATSNGASAPSNGSHAASAPAVASVVVSTPAAPSSPPVPGAPGLAGSPPASPQRTPAPQGALASTPPPPPSAMRAARTKASIAPAAPIAPAPVASPSPARSESAPRSGSSEARANDETAVQGRAVRVSIKRSARDPNLYVVRRLDGGKPLPFGVKQAMLVLDEADAEFFEQPSAPGRK